MIRAVLFDWGGVMAPNSGGGWLEVLAKMLAITVDELKPHWRAAGYGDLCRGYIDDVEFFRRLAASLSRSLPGDVSRIWIEGGAVEPWPEMASFVRTLKDEHFKVGLLSNTVRPLSRVLYKEGLYQEFAPLILSDEVGCAKPERAVYQRALDDLQLAASECVYVDDLLRNLEPARELGMVTVLASKDPQQTIAAVRRVMR